MPGLALTAAATVIEPTDEAEQRRIKRGAEAWQRESWNAYDELPEISFSANYQANALSRIRLMPAVQDDPREPPVPLSAEGADDDELTDIDEPTRAAMFATLNRLGNGPIGLTELARLISLNLFVAGDGYLVGYEHDGDEIWDCLSVDELVVGASGKGYARRMPNSSLVGQESFPEDAFICRLYQRHPRFSGWAYSAMRSILSLTNELQVLTNAIHAVATSRMPAGMIFLSNDFRTLPADPSLTGQPDEGANDPFAQAIIRHFEAPVKDRRSASSVVPFIGFGETATIRDGIKQLDFNRDIDSTYADMRAELIKRIAVGLDLPPEVLTGLGDLTHWNAWAVDEQTFKYHLEPDVQLMVNSLTQGYFRPHLRKMGIEGVDRFCIWYDATPLLAHPNRAGDYADAYDKLEVSGDAYRRAHNIPDSDKPDDDERAKRIWEKAVISARTAPIVFPTPDQIEEGTVQSLDVGGVPPVGGDQPEPPPAEPADQPGPPPLPAPSDTQAPKPSVPRGAAAVTLPPLAALVAAAPMSPLGVRLANIERTLRLRLLQAADDAMQRTLEKAGNRLRSLAQRGGAHLKATVADLDPLDVAGALGAQTVARLATSTDDLLAGSFAALGPSWTTWVRRAQEQALAAIADHGELSETDAERIVAQMTTHREEGWAFLAAALTTLAGRLLYEPHQPPPPKGEWADFTVPPGLIRDALSKAGGGPERGEISDLLNGTTVHGALSDAGLEVNGFTWLHGDPARPFEPHADLDGLSFESDDDDGLINPEDWPDVTYLFPGDHDGCTCSKVEAISRVEEDALA